MDWTFLQFGKLEPATWMYLSALLSIAVFFRFRRLFSLRNWDLITLYLLTPGLLATGKVDQMLADRAPESIVAAQSTADSTQAIGTLENNESWQRIKQFGYFWLFGLTAYFVVRTLVDVVILRRDRLEQNLTSPGIAFLTTCLFAYLIILIAGGEPEPEGKAGAHVASSLLAGQTSLPQYRGADPATILFMMPSAAVQRGLAQSGMKSADLDQLQAEHNIARSALIICHLLLLVGLVLIGWKHFQGIESGLAMALLYLLLPVTFFHSVKLDHLIPTTLLVWAIFLHQVPAAAGALMALASVSFFPLLLLPLWWSYYRQRGASLFFSFFIATTLALWLIVYLVPPLLSFIEMWSTSLSNKVLLTADTAKSSVGFWSTATQIYRLPIVIAQAILIITLVFVPKEKTLGDLIALSATLLLMTQFWYADRGGTHVLWYLPFLIMMVFRPNLKTRPNPLPTPAATIIERP
jgi:hypothetical protein